MSKVDSKAKTFEEDADLSLTSPPIPENDSGVSLAFPESQSQRNVKQVWAVGGGKGGIGKSLLASSLAISVARNGHRVVAVDLDLGGANLHTAMGVNLPRQTLGDFLSRRTDRLDNCLAATGIPNLELISGAHDSVGITSLPELERDRLISSLREIDTDYLVFDLGAGTGLNTLDFFLFADVGIVAILPEPTSIENAYRFIKSLFYRKLQRSPQLEPVTDLIELAMDPKNTQNIRTPADLFKEVNLRSPELGIAMKSEIAKFRPRLVVNQARTQTDVDIGFSIKSVCKKYFGIDVDYLGYLDYDSAAWQAVRRKRPLLYEFPNSRLVTSIERMTQHLLRSVEGS